MAELAALKKELDWYKSGDTHTCHDGCQRKVCVQGREIEALKKEQGEFLIEQGEFLSEHDENVRLHTLLEDATAELAALKKEREGLMDILARVAKYGPPEGETPTGTACAFCDMGYAGYSSRGDGHHDDACAVKDAQKALSPQPKGDAG
jgi:hypothetical protein